MKGIPLYLQIVNDIKENICNGNLQPNERILSESELVKKYRVSNITIKNAMYNLCDEGYIIRIKGKGSFVNSVENLQKIPQYVYSKYKRCNVKVHAIALIMPSMKTSVDQELLNAIEEELSSTQYMLLLKITRESQKQESIAIKRFIESGVSGFIIFPAENELYNNDIIKLSIDRFPFVFVDRYLKGVMANSVTTNNFDITRLAVSQLIKDDETTKIIFISPNANNSVTIDRIRGYEAALQDHNIQINRNNFCMIDLNIESKEEKYDIIYKKLKDVDNLTGIFCANEEIGNIVGEVLENNFPHLIPVLKLCCFDKTKYRYFNYIQQDINKIAKECINILTDTISGNTKVTNTVVNAKLIKARREFQYINIAKNTK